MFLTTEQIQRAYVACFARNADAGGLEYWKKQDFQSENQLYQFFVNSEEGQAIYGGKSNGEIVDIIYQNALARPAEDSGKAYWQSGLDAQNYDVATLIQAITQAAIENNEKTQTLIDAAVKNTKIEQIELATVIALGRPANVNEINAGLGKDQTVYDYLQDISKTAEFQKNGKTLYEVLSTKVKYLSADDGNFNMSNLANLLIAASENPQNNEQTAFSNQVVVSVATGNDILENPADAAKYEQKLSTSTGLNSVKKELEAIDANMELNDAGIIIADITTNNQPQPTPSPSPTTPTTDTDTDKVKEKQESGADKEQESDSESESGKFHLTIGNKDYVLKNNTVTVTYEELFKYTLVGEDITLVKGEFMGQTIASSDVSSFIMEIGSVLVVENSINFSGNSKETTTIKLSAFRIQGSTIEGGSEGSVINLTATENIESTNINGNVGVDNISVTVGENLRNVNIDGGDGDDIISIVSSIGLISFPVIKGGKGSDNITVSSGDAGSFVVFDYRNTDDFANGEVDIINGIGAGIIEVSDESKFSLQQDGSDVNLKYNDNVIAVLIGANANYLTVTS